MVKASRFPLHPPFKNSVTSSEFWTKKLSCSFRLDRWVRRKEDIWNGQVSLSVTMALKGTFVLCVFTVNLVDLDRSKSPKENSPLDKTDWFPATVPEIGRKYMAYGTRSSALTSDCKLAHSGVHFTSVFPCLRALSRMLGKIQHQLAQQSAQFCSGNFARIHVKYYIYRWYDSKSERPKRWKTKLRQKSENRNVHKKKHFTKREREIERKGGRQVTRQVHKRFVFQSSPPNCLAVKDDAAVGILTHSSVAPYLVTTNRFPVKTKTKKGGGRRGSPGDGTSRALNSFLLIFREITPSLAVSFVKRLCYEDHACAN